MTGAGQSVARPPHAPVLAWFLAALAVRIAIASQSIVTIDRLFLPDDTYYSLAIARNVARGLGPTADGHGLTNGFQPLVTFLQVPLFWLGLTPDGAAHFAVMQTALFGAMSVAAAGALLLRLGHRRAAWIAATILALDPAIIKNDLDGLETSLATLSVLLAAHLFLSARHCPGRHKGFALGCMLGIALLARIDTCFPVAVLGLLIFRLDRWVFAWAATGALIVVLPWWAYSLHAIGAVLPESGAAVRQIVLANTMPLRSSLLLALEACGQLFPLFAYESRPNACVGETILMVAALQAVRMVRDRRDDRLLAMLLFAASLQALFYAGFEAAFWFFPRYFGFFGTMLIMVVSLFLSGLAEARRGPLAERLAATGLAALLATGLLVSARGFSVFFGRPQTTVDRGASGAKGYREAALDLLGHLPSGARLGSLQSGALGFYAPADIAVFNLDGVVSKPAYRAFRDATLGDLIRREHIAYFADWRVNFGFLQARYGPDLKNIKFELLASAAPQGPDTMSLYRVVQSPK